MRSRWFESDISSPPYVDDSSDIFRECKSRTRLLREPEERKERMGGMWARPDVWLATVGGRYDTGRRDLRLSLSSALAASMDLGSSNWRWANAHSFIGLSAEPIVSTDGGRDWSWATGDVGAGVPMSSGGSDEVSRRRRALPVVVMAAAVTAADDDSDLRGW